MSILPFLLLCFSWFHALFHGFWVNFRTMHNLGFFIHQALSCEFDQWVLLLHWYIHDLWWLIWLIWGFVKIKNYGACIEPKLGILFNLVSIDEIGLLNWCNWSLFYVIYLVWWSIGQFSTNWTSGFSNFWFFFRNSMLKPILWTWT